MRKVNIEEKTKALNEFRLKNQTKSFTYGELREKLGELLSKNNIVINAAVKAFPYEMIGKSRLYSMPKDPIHWVFVNNAYKKQSKTYKDYVEKKEVSKEEELNEEQALKILTKRGYQIRKCVGFDLERFSKENPVLYKKYLKYEII